MKSELAFSRSCAMEVEAQMARKVADQQEQQARSAERYLEELSHQMSEMEALRSQKGVLNVGEVGMKSFLTDAQSRADQQKQMALALQEDAASKQYDIEKTRQELRQGL